MSALLWIAAAAAGAWIAADYYQTRNEKRLAHKALYKKRPRPWKIYNIVEGRRYSDKIVLNGYPILWLRYTSISMADERVSIRVKHKNGPKVAAAKLNPMGSGCRVLVGIEPGDAVEVDWMQVTDESFDRTTYAFEFGGKKYLWKETTEWMDYSCKLVDAAAPHDTLIICVLKHGYLRRVDFFDDLGSELETIGLMAIVAMVRKVLALAQHQANTNPVPVTHTMYLPAPGSKT